LFEPRGDRTGSAVVEGDRVDLFDYRSNRTGSGRIEDERRVDFFDPNGNRTGYAVIEGRRIDVFDGRSNWTGSGRTRGGEVEILDRQGDRRGGRWAAEHGRGPFVSRRSKRAYDTKERDRDRLPAETGRARDHGAKARYTTAWVPEDHLETMGMRQVYEREGVLEGDRVIRLKDPIPCAQGVVKVTVTRETEGAESQGPNRGALQALDRFLAETGDLTPEQWAELERLIEDHPFRIRPGAAT
jgi:hypothetical protein